MQQFETISNASALNMERLSRFQLISKRKILAEVVAKVGTKRFGSDSSLISLRRQAERGKYNGQELRYGANFLILYVPGPTQLDTADNVFPVKRMLKARFSTAFGKVPAWVRS